MAEPATPSSDSGSEDGVQVEDIVQRVSSIAPSHEKPPALYYSAARRIYEECFDGSEEALPALDQAIAYAKRARDLTASGNPDHGECLHFLSTLMQQRYKVSGNLQELHSAISEARLAKDFAKEQPQSREDYGDFCSDLAEILLQLYQQQGASEDDLVQLLSLYEIGVERGSTDPANKAASLGGLALAYVKKYHHKPLLRDLEKALKANQQALAIQPERCGYWLTAAQISQLLHQRDGKPELLDKSVEQASTAYEKMLKESRKDRPLSLEVFTKVTNFLASVLHDRYAQKGELKDLKTGVDLATAVLIKTPRTYPQYVRRSQVLGSLWHALYERTRKLQFLEESIKIAEDAAQRPSFQTAVADQALHYNNLAIRLHSLYSETRDRAIIQRAIEYATRAVNSLHHAHQDVLLRINLSSIYATRSATLGALKDLDEAIRIMSDVIESAPPNHAAWALDIFADMLSKKSLRDDNLATLKIAAGKQSQALELTPNDHLLKAGLIHNAWWVAMLRHLSAPDSNVLREAINMATRSVENWKSSDRDKGAVIHGLARLNGLLFQSTQDPNTLHLAILQAEEALCLCHDSSQYKSERYQSLGFLLFRQYKSTKEHNEKYLTTAIDNFIKGLHHKASPPYHRCSSGSMAGQLLARDARWQEAASVLRTTLELVPRISPRELDWDDQQFHLRNMSDLSSLAASAVLEAGGNADNALTLLEAGRGLMARIATGLRSDLQDLERANSQLAAEYADLRNRLATLSATQGVPPDDRPDTFIYAPGTDPVSQRLEIIESLDKLENKIRKEVSGFSNFLQPTPAKNFPALVKSTSHAVVAFNVTTYRSDAFLITTKRVAHLPLKDLLWADVKALAEMLVGPDRLTVGDLESLHSRNQQLRDALRSLWSAAVKPVLEELHFLSLESEGPLPHVIWITSGLVGLLPIHAAGSSWDVDRENTASHVISSYAPTFQALEASQAKATSSNEHSARKFLTVAMPKTTGWKPLSVSSEVELLRDLVPSQLFSLEVPDLASKEQVLKHLGDAVVVYFGCHADSDAKDPSNGGLYLTDGPDGKPEKLTVRDLARMNLPQARLAYLSACSTAENPSRQLRDEVIHLASTLQLVGFPNVVGTLWAVDDKAANQVSRLFFEHVMKQEKHLADLDSGAGRVDYALAIHEATKLVRQGRAGGGRRRQNASDNVTAWAPFIHMGS